MDTPRSHAGSPLPNEATRLAWYHNVNDQIRTFRGHQWTFATLVLALLFGIGKFTQDHKVIVSTPISKLAVTLALCVVAGLGAIHLLRLQAFMTTNKQYTICWNVPLD